jgi:hypothetical protein
VAALRARLILSLALLAVSVLAVSQPPAFATPLLATAITAKGQLRGHLPDIGETPSMRVFPTAADYESFKTSLGEADIFPPASSLYMSFDKEILALYHRGNDSGGRCLRTESTATLDGDTVDLNLYWEAGTCGAPSTAHHPFVMASLSRTAQDRSNWIMAGRQVCASAPGVDGTRACASVTGEASPSPTPTPRPTNTPTPRPTATPTASPARTPSPTPTVAPTRSVSPQPTTQPTARPTAGGSATNPAPSATPTVAGVVGGSESGEPPTLVAYAFIAAGLGLGVIVLMLFLRRRGDYQV